MRNGWGVVRFRIVVVRIRFCEDKGIRGFFTLQSEKKRVSSLALKDTGTETPFS